MYLDFLDSDSTTTGGYLYALNHKFYLSAPTISGHVLHAPSYILTLKVCLHDRQATRYRRNDAEGAYGDDCERISDVEGHRNDVLRPPQTYAWRRPEAYHVPSCRGSEPRHAHASDAVW